MSMNFSRRLAFVACMAASLPVVAQQGGTRAAAPARSVSTDAKLPTTVTARRIEGIQDKETTAEGDVLLRRGNRSISADWLRFDNETQEVEAKGNVRLEQDRASMSGPALKLRTTDSVGTIEKPTYSFSADPKPGMPPVSGRGEAERIELQGDGLYKLVNATFTTCVPGDDSWYVSVEELSLDYGREVGTANWATVHFFGTPILKAPYLDFSLNNQRKSGFLTPTFAMNGKNGPEVALPYYFNLAPNYDLTVTPRLMAKRGLMVGNEFRYMEADQRGNARLEFLPDDQVRGGRRSAISWVHAFDRGPYAAGLSLNKVSDDDYFRDLSSRINFVAQTYLPREGFARYGGTWWDSGTWSVTARAQNFQTLQQPNSPVVAQYARLPQVSLSAVRPDIHGMDLNLGGEVVDFHHPSQVKGVRTTVTPSLSMPLVAPGGYVTPKIGFHSSTYSLSNAGVGAQTSIQRTLPVFSLDSGLVFEKDTGIFGREFTQTLEPRAYYLYVPYKDQSRIPVFDTAVADFNYAQIFSDNSFTGGDRVADANQVTLALTSRLLSPSTGQEAVRALIAQRYYFRKQLVTLNAATPPRDFLASDYLASLTGRVSRDWTVEGATQYNQRQSQVERLTLATRYQPDTHKTLNLSYRFLRQQFNQFDVSGQWPLASRLYGVGRYNYSVRDHRVVEALAGFEYNADCWIGRVVFQRFAVASGGVATHAIFLQLELNGFSRIGSDPFEALKRNIPGYTRLNQTLNPGRTGNFEDF
jgi:LPS-assembly protein